MECIINRYDSHLNQKYYSLYFLPGATSIVQVMALKRAQQIKTLFLIDLNITDVLYKLLVTV